MCHERLASVSEFEPEAGQVGARADTFHKGV